MGRRDQVPPVPAQTRCGHDVPRLPRDLLAAASISSVLHGPGPAAARGPVRGEAHEQSRLRRGQGLWVVHVSGSAPVRNKWFLYDEKRNCDLKTRDFVFKMMNFEGAVNASLISSTCRPPSSRATSGMPPSQRFNFNFKYRCKRCVFQFKNEHRDFYSVVCCYNSCFRFLAAAATAAVGCGMRSSPFSAKSSYCG